MSDLKELYQEVILEHSKSPRNFGTITPCSHQGHGHNPLCGDTVTVFLQLSENDRISDIKFEGKGCAISIASASIMSETLKGSNVHKATETFDQFLQLITGDDVAVSENTLDEKLNALFGVKQFPMRVKCATLPWHAFKAALNGQQEVSTEK